MTDQEQQLLIATVADVCERFAFMFVDAPMDATPEFDADLHRATLAFKGPRQGTLALVAPPDMAHELAGNVLGLMDPDEVTDEVAGQALAELLNIICGELVAELFGKQVVVELGVPEIDHVPAAEVARLTADVNTVRLMVDEESVFVTLALTT